MSGASILNLLKGPMPLPSLGGNPQSGQGASPSPSGGQGAAPPQGGAQTPQSQSPPDLAQLYMQLEQRNRSANEIDRGLSLMAASMSTPSMANAIMGSIPQQQDPGAMMGNMMKLQQMQMQQRGMQAMLSPEFINEMAQRTGMSPNMVAATIYSGKGGDLLTSLAGISGPQNMQDMTRARTIYMSQHGITDLNDPRLPNYFLSPDKWQIHTQTEGDNAKEVVNTQHNFGAATQAYDMQLSNVNQLLDPNNKQYINEFLGPYQSKFKPTGQLSPQAQALKQVYDNVMAGQFGSAVQDFPGSRISTKELQADAPSKSTMGLAQGYDSFLHSTQQYRDQIAQHRADLFGKAEQQSSPNLSDYDYDHFLNDIYKTGAQAPEGGIQRAAPVTIQSPGDVAKMAKGRAYVVPQGYPEAGQIRYAGY